MPIIGSRAAAGIRSFGLYVLAALTSVLDTFNRSDNPSDLGSISGQKWKIWRGIWGIVSNKASSSSSASEYAMATLTFTKTDAVIGVSSPDPGTGMTFWVSDADNWYASVYTQEESCETCFNCNSWNASNCNAFCGGNCKGWTCNSGYCNSWNAIACIGNWNVNSYCAAWDNICVRWNNPCQAWRNTAPKGQCTRWGIQCNGRVLYCVNSGYYIGNCNLTQWSNCNAYFCNAASCTGGFNPVNCCGNYNASNCNAFFSYSCNCTTQHRIKIISSIASSISTVVSTLWSSTIASFKTVLSGNSATIRAYSSSDYTSQIGSDYAENLSSPVKNKKFGIIKSPSGLNQGSSIEEFRVE